MLRSIARCHEVAMYPVTLNVKGRRCLVVGGGWGALRVSEAAASAGVWVNVADAPALCTFPLPARVRRGSLQLSIASAGESPFVVRRLRAFLERRFGPEWTAWIEAAGRFRGAVRALGLPRDERERRYDLFFDAPGDTRQIRARVAAAEALAG